MRLRCKGGEEIPCKAYAFFGMNISKMGNSSLSRNTLSRCTENSARNSQKRRGRVPSRHYHYQFNYLSAALTWRSNLARLH